MRRYVRVITADSMCSNNSGYPNRTVTYLYAISKKTKYIKNEVGI